MRNVIQVSYLGHMTTAQSVTGTVPEFSVHDRLRKAREHSGLSQLELAAAMEVSRNTVSNYESGAVTNLRKLVMNAWALSTGVPVRWLWTGMAEPPSDHPDGGLTCAMRESNSQPADLMSDKVVTGSDDRDWMHAQSGKTPPARHTGDPVRHMPAA